ncbi:hypothetical protein [Cellvibrio polysaccharolyticus]|uniref:Uncharacterized protein n=1 Tax=Cellvibrio polysaccharolyticus TaxID=2082724 RepID=A0A928V2H3_9GAMM|nr:hypothetical protein [Cellvibrio polysaccharolyticus]MBE8715746.1 hypothetical protein [Cellvibrio polysaccharolyticus]
MPILSRRATQHLINETSQFIPTDALRQLVSKLNAGNIKSLDALWEIIVINLLSEIGKVNYEFNHGGTSRPDIHFISQEFEMVSDITCISDQDSIKKNDIEYFLEEFRLVSKKLGVSSLSGFDFRFGGTDELRKKIRLKLPEKSETRKFIEYKFKAFMQNIAKLPNIHHQIDSKYDDIEIAIKYVPRKSTLSMGYPSFKKAPTLHNNVLYNRLIKKRDQLKKSGFHGIKGIFICDGDCDLFTNQSDSYGSYGAISIIDNFLSSQETISFVFLIHVKEQTKGIFGNEITRNFEIISFSKKNCYSKIADLTIALNRTIEKFSKPERNATNSINVLRAGHYIPGADFYGGFQMTGKKIRISLRTVLRLITGELSHKDFLRDHQDVGAILLDKISSGYLLKSLNIIREETSDDDWLEFYFDETLDPALNQYFVKNTES